MISRKAEASIVLSRFIFLECVMYEKKAVSKYFIIQITNLRIHFARDSKDPTFRLLLFSSFLNRHLLSQWAAPFLAAACSSTEIIKRKQRVLRKRIHLCKTSVFFFLSKQKIFFAIPLTALMSSCAMGSIVYLSWFWISMCRLIRSCESISLILPLYCVGALICECIASNLRVKTSSSGCRDSPTLRVISCRTSTFEWKKTCAVFFFSNKERLLQRKY